MGKWMEARVSEGAIKGCINVGSNEGLEERRERIKHGRLMMRIGKESVKNGTSGSIFGWHEKARDEKWEVKRG